jgi:hypothetical protein
MNGKFLISWLSLPFVLSPSTRRPFVLSLVEGNGLLLRTGSSKGERDFLSESYLSLGSVENDDSEL